MWATISLYERIFEVFFENGRGRDTYVRDRELPVPSEWADFQFLCGSNEMIVRDCACVIVTRACLSQNIINKSVIFQILKLKFSLNFYALKIASVKWYCRSLLYLVFHQLVTHSLTTRFFLVFPPIFQKCQFLSSAYTPWYRILKKFL